MKDYLIGLNYRNAIEKHFGDQLEAVEKLAHGSKKPNK